MPALSRFREPVHYRGFVISPMFGTTYWWISYGGRRVGPLSPSIKSAKRLINRMS